MAKVKKAPVKKSPLTNTRIRGCCTITFPGGVTETHPNLTQGECNAVALQKGATAGPVTPGPC